MSERFILFLVATSAWMLVEVVWLVIGLQNGIDWKAWFFMTSGFGLAAWLLP